MFLAGAFGNYRSLDGGASFARCPRCRWATTSGCKAWRTIRWWPAACCSAPPTACWSASTTAAATRRATAARRQRRRSGIVGPVIIDATNSSRWLAFSVSGDVFLSGNAGLNWIPASAGLRGYRDPDRRGASDAHNGCLPACAICAARRLHRRCTSPTTARELAALQLGAAAGHGQRDRLRSGHGGVAGDHAHLRRRRRLRAGWPGRPAIAAVCSAASMVA